MATSNPSHGKGAVLPGWQSDCYQATAGPVMLAGVPQGFLIALALPSILVGMIMPKLLIIPAVIYLAAFIGTRWEPNWKPMLQEYFSYEAHYEG